LKGNEWEDKATGQKRSTLEIRADRIQELDWEERAGGAPQNTGRPASNITDEQVPEDDMPF
jgi:single-stranded DNA-binding protein